MVGSLARDNIAESINMISASARLPNELRVSVMNLNNDLRRIGVFKRFLRAALACQPFSFLLLLRRPHLSKRWGSDLTGWPLMSHEYRGTTCLQSNAVNTESNAPPGITIHVPWLYLRGAKGSTTTSAGLVSMVCHLRPLRAQKKTHFLCRPINFVWLHSREPQSLSHRAMWPISHRFPRLRNDRVFV